MANWLQELWPSDRLRVFEAMREARASSDLLLERSRELSPRGGEIAVGGEHFTAFVNGEAIAVILRRIAAGDTPEAAREFARVWARESIAVFNRQRGGDYVVHRHEGHADQTIARWALRIDLAVQRFQKR